MLSRVTSKLFIVLFVLCLTSVSLATANFSVTAQEMHDHPMPADAFILLNASSFAEMDQAIDFIKTQGGAVPLSFSPKVLFVRLPLGINTNAWIGQAGIQAIHIGEITSDELNQLNDSQAALAAKVWNHWQDNSPFAINAEINVHSHPATIEQLPHVFDIQPHLLQSTFESPVLNHKVQNIQEPATDEDVHEDVHEDDVQTTIPIDAFPQSIQNREAYRPLLYQTSEFLLGSYQVDLFLPESTGNGENWSEERRDEAIIGVATGIIWWASAAEQQGTRVPELSFNITVHDPFVTPNEVATQYEPINLSPESEIGAGLWVNEIMDNMGYGDKEFGGLPAHLANAWSYVDARRTESNRDWGFAVFIVDSLNDDGDVGFFPDGQRFAFAWRYGPFLTMTYDTGNYAQQIGVINGLKINTVHELGHIFGAPEEYNVGCTVSERGGYFYVYNTNCEADGVPPFELSPMRIPDIQLEAMPAQTISTPLRWMAGWRDSDSDGLMDPLDTTPVLAIQEITNSGGGQYQYKGVAMDIPFAIPDQRVQETVRSAITINTIQGVQYRLLPQSGDAGWQDCTAQSGSFDSAEEEFICAISGESGTNIEFKVYNSVGNSAIALTTSLASATQSRADSPPQLAAQIAGGSDYTQDTTVNLALSALSPTTIHASRVGYKGNWSDWEAYDGGVTVVLNRQDGPHTVELQIQDAEGQISDTQSQTVFLDETEPTGSITLNDTPTNAGSATLELILNAEDSSGVVAMNVYANGAWYGWEVYQNSKTISALLAEGVNDFKVRYRDMAGNLSDVYLATVAIEVATPEPTLTPVPTDTAVATNTPAPTNTPVPTNTAIPTATIAPVNTPVPVVASTAVPESPSVSTGSEIYLPLLTK